MNWSSGTTGQERWWEDKKIQIGRGQIYKKREMDQARLTCEAIRDRAH